MTSSPCEVLNRANDIFSFQRVFHLGSFVPLCECSFLAVKKMVGLKKSCKEERAMDAFSSLPSSGSSSQRFSDSNFKDQLKTQLAQAYAEDFLKTIRVKCLIIVLQNQGQASVVVRLAAYLGVWITTLRLLALLSNLSLVYNIDFLEHKIS